MAIVAGGRCARAVALLLGRGARTGEFPLHIHTHICICICGLHANLDAWCLSASSPLDLWRFNALVHSPLRREQPQLLHLCPGLPAGPELCPAQRCGPHQNQLLWEVHCAPNDNGWQIHLSLSPTPPSGHPRAAPSAQATALQISCRCWQGSQSGPHKGQNQWLYLQQYVRNPFASTPNPLHHRRVAADVN